MAPRQRTLAELADDGLCVDGWRRWQQGSCGTYAVALLRLRPDLTFGGTAFDVDGGPGHFVAFDDRFAYDSAGRHPLPYRGVHGDGRWLGAIGDPADFGLPDEEAGPDGPEAELAAARDHIVAHGILDGRFADRR